ncbi:MAG: hypothetical protein AABW80_04475 [Nanoarchaeota archaeon]
MATRTKTREITVFEKAGRFEAFFKMLSPSEEGGDFEGLSALRKLLSNEKARLLNVIKTKKPKSIYELAKMLGRDFKSVKEDIKLLERFGFIDMIAEKTGKRERLKPKLVVDSINIIVHV